MSLFYDWKTMSSDQWVSAMHWSCWISCFWLLISSFPSSFCQTLNTFSTLSVLIYSFKFLGAQTHLYHLTKLNKRNIKVSIPVRFIALLGIQVCLLVCQIQSLSKKTRNSPFPVSTWYRSLLILTVTMCSKVDILSRPQMTKY